MKGMAIIMKKSVTILLSLAILLIFCLGMALPVSGAPLEQIYLRDNGDVLTDAEEARLSEKLEKVGRERECDIAVVTVRTLNGRNVQRYAHELYDIHGYGQGSDRDGILLLISVGDREYAFSVNGFAHRSLSEKALDRIEDDVVASLSEDRYAAAIDAFADNCDYLLGLARDGKSYNPFPWVILPISLVLGFLIALVSVNSMKNKLKTVRFAGNAANYVRRDSLVLRDSREIYLYSTVTKIPKPKNNGSGRSSSGGSSGGSRGGRSGHF